MLKWVYLQPDFQRTNIQNSCKVFLVHSKHLWKQKICVSLDLTAVTEHLRIIFNRTVMLQFFRRGLKQLTEVRIWWKNTQEQNLRFLNSIFSLQHSFHSSIRPNYVAFCLDWVGRAVEVQSVSNITWSLVAKSLIPTHMPWLVTPSVVLRHLSNWVTL